MKEEREDVEQEKGQLKNELEELWAAFVAQNKELEELQVASVA